MTRPLVVMGVSGSGKSTLGASLAVAMGGVFLDADDLHPAANVAKMRAGIPLDDDDRWPWLDAVGRAVADADGAVVCACSALRRVYRDRLQAIVPGLAFIELAGPREVLAQRMSTRPGHFMPTSLLDSQLATWEPLAGDEAGITVDIRDAVETQTLAAAAWAQSTR
jgi:gluconokinase